MVLRDKSNDTPCGLAALARIYEHYDAALL